MQRQRILFIQNFIPKQTRILTTKEQSIQPQTQVPILAQRAPRSEVGGRRTAPRRKALFQFRRREQLRARPPRRRSSARHPREIDPSDGRRQAAHFRRVIERPGQSGPPRKSRRMRAEILTDHFKKWALVPRRGPTGLNVKLGGGTGPFGREEV